MNKKISLWALVILIVVVCAGCSSNNNSGNGSNDKPLPQVRVGALPSATATLPGIGDNSAPTPEPSVSPTAAWMYYDPTPDVDTIANDIQNTMNDIDHKLNNANFNFSK